MERGRTRRVNRQTREPDSLEGPRRIRPLAVIEQKKPHQLPGEVSMHLYSLLLRRRTCATALWTASRDIAPVGSTLMWAATGACMASISAL